MKTKKVIISLGLLFIGWVVFQGSTTVSDYPYKSAGLSERQAAAHLLDRFTYSSTPSDIDNVVQIGIEKWFLQQLDGNLNDELLNTKLKDFPAINLSNRDVMKIYPRNAILIRDAVKKGIINKDSVGKAKGKEYREQLASYMRDNGYKPQQELYREFINQKILRAVYTNNQVQEVMTDFWFNHFNVSITKNQCAEFIPAYERDVIRPNVFGKFSDLLVATAKSPAMLFYLDNFSSSGVQLNQREQNPKNKKRLSSNAKDKVKTPAKKNAQGLNENYAREVMELHTLGVDGGYTQHDVTEAARVLTGWTVVPFNSYNTGGNIVKLIETEGDEQLTKRGFVHDGDFLFVPNRHDNGEKTVLGHKFPAGGGYMEGVDLLNMLATNKATAKFISKKLAVRFVSDAPSPKLIDQLSNVYLRSNGDIKELLKAIVRSPEFWRKDNLREKTKSPFELTISAVRSLKADVLQPYQLFNWINRMGQKFYYYQAPTGFPDNGQYWINTGSLLNRMNFGLSVAAQKIPGVRVNLVALNNNHEPESAVAALSIYCKVLLPERDVAETIKRLTPMLGEKNLATKINLAASKNTPPQSKEMDMTTMQPEQSEAPAMKNNRNVTSSPMLSQVVGIIIGSPEFQRK